MCLWVIQSTKGRIASLYLFRKHLCPQIRHIKGRPGTNHLDVPIGIENANQPVRLVIEPTRQPMTPAEWDAFMRSIAGSITDPTLERPLQLPLETRESLS